MRRPCTESANRPARSLMGAMAVSALFWNLCRRDCHCEKCLDRDKMGCWMALNVVRKSTP
jgi:hypothetical protein